MKSVRSLRHYSIAAFALSALAFGAPVASTAANRDHCSRLIQDISASFEHDFELGYAGSALPLLSRKDIVSKGENIGALGRVAEGVFSVETRNGPAALKLFNGGMTPEDMKVSFLLQKHLGDLGIAPKVLGVFDGTEAMALSHSRWTTAGLLMEKLEGGSFVKYTPLGKPRLFYTGESLSPAALRKAKEQVRRFSATLEHLHVYAEDIQFMVWPDGELKAIDFDFYVWKNRSGHYAGYNASSIDKFKSGKLPFKNDFEPILKEMDSLGAR